MITHNAFNVIFFCLNGDNIIPRQVTCNIV